MTDERTTEELRTRLAVLEREGKARIFRELEEGLPGRRTISYLSLIHI